MEKVICYLILRLLFNITSNLCISKWSNKVNWHKKYLNLTNIYFMLELNSFLALHIHTQRNTHYHLGKGRAAHRPNGKLTQVYLWYQQSPF